MLKQFFSFPNQNKVGDVVSSMLNETQFQAERDSTWVLVDGRSVVGSDFEALTGLSNLPDGRGVTLRGKNNGRSDGNENPDGELALGAFQNDDFVSHNHGISAGTGVSAGGGFGALAAGAEAEVSTNRGGNETRMKNITTNWFVKINK